MTVVPLKGSKTRASGGEGIDRASKEVSNAFIEPVRRGASAVAAVVKLPHCGAVVELARRGAVVTLARHGAVVTLARRGAVVELARRSWRGFCSQGRAEDTWRSRPCQRRSVWSLGGAGAATPRIRVKRKHAAHTQDTTRRRLTESLSD
jgi:hypothetical protein